MSTEKKPVRVAPLVLKGLDVVRRSHETSIFDQPGVATLAERFGYPEAAAWVREHKREYIEGTLRGFESTELSSDKQQRRSKGTPPNYNF